MTEAIGPRQPRDLPPASASSRQRACRDMRERPERNRLRPDAERGRAEFCGQHIARIVRGHQAARVEAARHTVEKWAAGVLLPDVILPFDDEELSGRTVGDVLANPERFMGATLADPLEGPEYGRGKAKVMRRSDGWPWINSFAHGRVVYELRYDITAADAAIAGVPPDQAAETFVRIAAHSISQPTSWRLCAIGSRRSRVLGNALSTRNSKPLLKERAVRAKEEARDRAAANRRDARPRIPAPKSDAPWLPQMEVLNEVLGSSHAPEPPMRDIDGVITQVRVRRVPNMHALTSEGVN